MSFVWYMVFWARRKPVKALPALSFYTFILLVVVLKIFIIHF